MRRKGGGLKSVYEELGSYGNFFGLCADLASVENNWPSIAGDALARRSSPRSFEDGVLVVVVENKLVQQDINFRKSAIMREINSHTVLALKDIKTEVGPPLKKTAARSGVKKRKKRAPPAAKGPELERVKNEIMERHPALGEELAAAIARCRASGYKARQR
ncbi:MAG: DUF721 domain-containing protein [Synergistaceae bacterium]|nr:DUF721 domain-containing protein [Synergistaceae bacterium]